MNYIVQPPHSERIWCLLKGTIPTCWTITAHQRLWILPHSCSALFFCRAVNKASSVLRCSLWLRWCGPWETTSKNQRHLKFVLSHNDETRSSSRRGSFPCASLIFIHSKQSAVMSWHGASRMRSSYIPTKTVCKIYMRISGGITAYITDCSQ